MSSSFGNIILNILYPPHCVFCKERLSPKSTFSVCTKCSNTLPYCKSYKRCKICGMPISENSGDTCNDCLSRRHYSYRSTSAFIYTDNAKRVIINYKNYKNISYAKVLSKYMSAMVKDDFKGVNFDMVLSVPPRFKALNSDSFDQAGNLASVLAKRLELKYVSGVLVRCKNIKKQSSLGYKERLKNVEGAFKVKSPSKVIGKTILLADDVRTTGATLEECSKVLKQAGAYRVYCVTAATTIKA